MSVPPEALTIKHSERFNADDADVIFKSSDEVLFRIHKKNLECNTGGFLLEEEKSDKLPIQLCEDSETLEILLQYIYPKRHPTLADLDFEVLVKLTEAAEKYEVFSAMNICNIRMTEYLDERQFAEHIMTYATKHGYYDMCDIAAPMIVSMSITRAAEILPDDLILPWMLYRQQWEDKLKDAIAVLGTFPYRACDHNCRTTHNLIKSLTLALFDDPKKSVSAIPIYCKSCSRDKYEPWVDWVRTLKKTNMKAFSKFI